MRKEIYLISGLENETYEGFSDRILALAKEISIRDEVHQLKVSFTNSPPPKISIIPFKKKKIAAFSLYKNTEELIDLLIQSKGFSGAYSVDEVVPVNYEKTWNDLTFTPGICLFTLFKQKEGISYDQFIDTWHNSHTPLSLKIHPLWNYNRNVVSNKLTSSTFPWDGIVEEQFRTVSDLLNPIKFFGNPLVMPYRMWQVYSDTQSFLDYKSIEPYYASELFIKS
jgi:hypothetical protein